MLLTFELLEKPEFGEMTFFNIETQKNQANTPNSGKS